MNSDQSPQEVVELFLFVGMQAFAKRLSLNMTIITLVFVFNMKIIFFNYN